jgi:hypothetical protein
MYGRTDSRALTGVIILAVAAVSGCGEARPQPPAEKSAPLSDAGESFDPSTAGAVAGRVRWKREFPAVQPLVDRPGLTASGFQDEQTHWPNPNAPEIGPTGAVKGAVVFLRGIDPRRGRAWDLPNVRVVQEGRRLHVRQGDADGAVGFVRRGDAVEMVSEDSTLYALHAAGAAFFTLTFPVPHRPRSRRLSDSGVVELTSALGAFWMRGYLFVDDHPYYTRTDADGRYRLPEVPPGRYEAVCWLPDWRVERHERDPETSLVTRVYFRPALQWVAGVEVGAGATAAADFEAGVR